MRNPYSQEAEMGVLGAMLLRNELIDQLSADLVAEDFYWPEHQDLFRAMLELHSQGKPVDPVTIADHRDTVITEDGPESSLWVAGNIARNVPSAANGMTYAHTVRERSLDRGMIRAADQLRELATSESSQADKVAAAQALVLGLDSKTTVQEVRHACDVLDDHLEELQRRADLGGQLDGLSTGIPDLDAKLMGLKPGDMVVIAGRPAMGKTTLAMNIAEHTACTENLPALVVSLEMKNGGLMDRALASLGRIPLTRIKDGTVFDGYSDQLAKAGTRIKQSKLFLADRSGMTVARLRSMARRHKQRYGLSLLVIDYLQLLEGSGKAGNRTEDVSDMSRQCKLMAMELGVPVIVLSQLNRGLEQRPNKRPIMSDLRESGAIEQDADVIVFVYRDEIYHPDSPAKGTAEIILGKHRNGEPGTVRAAFLGQYSRFEQLAPSALMAINFDPEPRPAKVTTLADRYGKGKH